MLQSQKQNLKNLLVLCLLSLSTQARGEVVSSYAAEKVKQVSASRQWRALLHFKPHFGYFSERSLVDTRSFFIAKDGHKNAEAEMHATLAAFDNDVQKYGDKKQSAYCAFPARRKFLEKSFAKKWPIQKCEDYAKVFSQLKPISASIMFAASYPNNPASMFGHTFIKINTSPNNDLLNHGLGYAAMIPGNEPSAAFMLFGLIGEYWGRFSFDPYYKKVNEYTNVESRDIWEYVLTLTEEEIRFLLDHVWELESTGFSKYYFFDENCALQLLMILEATKPEWELSNLLIYYIPGETVKQVAFQPGAVREVKFRPSLQKQMQQNYGVLNEDEKKKFAKITSGKTDFKSSISNIQNTWVLDSLITYYQYQRQKSSEGLTGENLSKLQDLLAKRAEIPASIEKREVPEVLKNTRPDLGHDSYRYSFGLGYKDGTGGIADDPNQSHQMFYEFHWRSSYHDLLSSDEGFANFSEIEVPTVDIRYYAEQEKFRLDRLQIAKTTSIFPLSFLESRPSWAVNVGYFTPRDFTCDNCHVAHVETGAGGALGLFEGRGVIYSLLLAQLELSPDFQKGYRYGPKLSTALITNLTREGSSSIFRKTKLKLGYDHFWDIDQDERAPYFGQYSFNLSKAISRNNEVRFGATYTKSESLTDDDTELKLNWLHYFN
jgi:hypothetical protein